MLHTLFSLDSLVIVAVFAALSLVLAVAADLLVFRFAPLAHLAKQPPVAPFFVAASTVFALFLAFAAANAWQTDDKAHRAAQAERAALERLAHVTTLLHPQPAAVLVPLRVYLEASLHDEWRGSLNRHAAPAAAAALRAMEDAVWSAHAKAGLDLPVADLLVRTLGDLEGARAGRLAIGRDYGDDMKWSLLFALAFLSLVAVAMVHADRPRAGRAALALFAAVIAVSTTTVALYEFPYAGAMAEAPEPFQRLLDSLPR